jgi:adenylate cyclase
MSGGQNMSLAIPANENGRLDALRRYKILDTAPEVAYDEITELAAQICGCPVAVIGFVDERQDWKKSKYGLPADFTGLPREISICSTTICSGNLLHVGDLTKDERFRDNPIVTGPPHLRFYCGMPLVTPDGYALGTLCIVDFQPREISFEQGETVRRLARQVMTQLELRRRVLELDQTLAELRESRVAITEAKEKSENLLLNILPVAIAEELKQHGKVMPRHHDSVSILFADFKGFTRLAEGMEPAALIQLLDEYFTKFDELAIAHGMEKLKTIGDSYMCVGGLPETNRTHPVDACLMGLAMQAFVDQTKRQRDRFHLPSLELRVGVHTGPVMSGIVGKRKFTYDIWGDAVNVASLLETNGAPGRVNISESTHHRVKTLFVTEVRGSVEAKNKGPLAMFFVNRIKPEFSADAEGRVPNERFQSQRSGVVSAISQWPTTPAAKS